MASVPPDPDQPPQPPHVPDWIERALSGDGPDVQPPEPDGPKMSPIDPRDVHPLPGPDPVNQAAPIDDLPDPRDQRDEFDRMIDQTDVVANDSSPSREVASADVDVADAGDRNSGDHDADDHDGGGDHDAGGDHDGSGDHDGGGPD